jgi:protein-disulfide isomerase
MRNQFTPKEFTDMTKKKQEVEQEEIEQEEVEKPTSPALTINIEMWATPIVGLVMLVIGLLAGYYVRPLTLAQADTTTPNLPVVGTPQVVIPTADNSAVQQSLMDSLIPKMRHFKGDPNAPVTIIEFADFQCPFCGKFFAETKPQIDEQYIQNGKVRLGYWNFAFLGDESTWAAESAECAADQDKFWEYHDKLYASQSGENQGAFNKDNLKKFAEELGLDTKSFNECLDSGKYTSLIQEDTSTSSALGVQSTPTFLVNGQAIVGAQPFEAFQQIIDPLLK